eukprot:GHVN01027720.1.p1 GENE.GHVN01027720.1~~GHVN01027720.1.p1  ORF type:complete len:598 (+),score=60.95 GHVN01027720.1:225-2018(+)
MRSLMGRVLACLTSLTCLVQLAQAVTNPVDCPGHPMVNGCIKDYKCVSHGTDLPKDEKAPFDSYNDVFNGNKTILEHMRFLQSLWLEIPGNSTSWSKEWCELFPEGECESIYDVLPQYGCPERNDGVYNIGRLSKAFLEHSILYFNYIQAIAGYSKRFIGPRKQEMSQAAAYSNEALPPGNCAGHYPAEADCIKSGICDAFYQTSYDVRSMGNLQMGYAAVNSCDRDPDYTEKPHNSLYQQIFCESDRNSIEQMGHRKSLLWLYGNVGIGYTGYERVYGTGVNDEAADKAEIPGYDDYFQMEAIKRDPVSRGIFRYGWPGYATPIEALKVQLSTDGEEWASHQQWTWFLYAYDDLVPSEEAQNIVSVDLEHYSGPFTTRITKLHEKSYTIDRALDYNQQEYNEWMYEGEPFDGPPNKLGVTGGDFASMEKSAFFRARMPCEWFLEMNSDLKDPTNDINFHMFRWIFHLNHTSAIDGVGEPLVYDSWFYSHRYFDDTEEGDTTSTTSGRTSSSTSSTEGSHSSHSSSSPTSSSSSSSSSSPNTSTSPTTSTEGNAPSSSSPTISTEGNAPSSSSPTTTTKGCFLTIGLTLVGAMITLW